MTGSANGRVAVIFTGLSNFAASIMAAAIAAEPPMSEIMSHIPLPGFREMPPVCGT